MVVNLILYFHLHLEIVASLIENIYRQIASFLSIWEVFSAAPEAYNQSG